MERVHHWIGNRVKEERTRLGLSLRQLAAKAKVSASMLCMIERGSTNPSVVSMFAIAGALGLPLSHFFDAAAPLADDGVPLGAEDPASDPVMEPYLAVKDVRRPAGGGPVLPVDDRATIELTGGITWERLTRDREPGMEFLEIRYEAGATAGERPYTHGGREWGMVLEGELLVQLGFEEHLLRVGDTIVFDSTTPHRLSNPGTRPARAIWLNFARGTANG